MFGNLYRGDIYSADLSPAVGSEQSGSRPVLIIQNDTGNRFSSTVIVAAITSVDKKSGKFPTHCCLGSECIVIMVPGLYLYRAIYNIGTNAVESGVSWFVEAILMIAALPIGLVFARIMTDRSFRHCS